MDMGSLRTQSTEAAEDPMPQKTPSGVAEFPPTTPVDLSPGATASKTIPDRSGALSADERWKLAKIRRNRNQGWMPTFEEFDFLLEIVERISRC